MHKKMKLEIMETESLLLRRLTDEDYDHIFEKLPDAKIMEMLNISTATELALEKQKQKKGYATFNKKVLIFQIFERHSLEIIGWCGYHTWYIDHRRAEIGYVLTSEVKRNQGIMAEALASVLDYGFKHMNLTRIEAFIGSDNLVSRKLIKKFKFKKEGCLRAHYFYNGKFEDSLVYGLLKSDLTLESYSRHSGAGRKLT